MPDTLLTDPDLADKVCFIDFGKHQAIHCLTICWLWDSASWRTCHPCFADTCAAHVFFGFP